MKHPFGDRHPFGDAAEAQREMLRNPRGDDIARLRQILALTTRGGLDDIRRMSDTEVRARIREQNAEFKRAHEERVRLQAAAIAPVVVAAAPVVRPAPEEQRYPLTVMLTYDPTPAVSTNKVLPARFKWQNEVTGPESRRSGEIKTSDLVFSDLRRRELSEGDYSLEFQNAALDARAIKSPRR